MNVKIKGGADPVNICLSSPNCCDWLLGQCGEQCQPSMWPSNKPTNHFIPIMTPFPSSLCLTKIAPRIIIPWLGTISITKGILFTNPAIIANLALSRNLWLLQLSPITSWQQWSLKNKSNISYILCMSNETLFYKKNHQMQAAMKNLTLVISFQLKLIKYPQNQWM